MKEVFIGGLYYAIEFLKVWLVSQGIFGIKIRKRIRYGFLLSLIVMVINPWYDIVNDNPIVYMIIMYIAFFLSLEKKKHVGWIIVINIGISIVDVLISCVAVFFNPSFKESIVSEPFLTVIFNLISFGIFALIYLYKNRKMLHKGISLPTDDAFIYIVICITLLILIAPVQLRILGRLKEWSVLSSVLSGVLLIFSVVILRIKRQHELMRMEKDMMMEVLDTQKRYYLNMLKNEEETKAFRHDIKEYLFCIQTLHNNKQYDQLDSYLQQMMDRAEGFSPRFSTGNDYVNMILNDMVSQYEDVNIELNGKFPPIKLEDIDVCSLFYNLLKNSFEAVQEVDNKEIRMNIKLQGLNLIVELINPYNHISLDGKGGYKTTKEGKNHGYGLKNIKRCIKKYNGEYTASSKDGVFRTEILIPDAIVNT
jgi:hypothetical protein